MRKFSKCAIKKKLPRNTTQPQPTQIHPRAYMAASAVRQMTVSETQVAQMARCTLHKTHHDLFMHNHGHTIKGNCHETKKGPRLFLYFHCVTENMNLRQTQITSEIETILDSFGRVFGCKRFVEFPIQNKFPTQDSKYCFVSRLDGCSGRPQTQTNQLVPVASSPGRIGFLMCRCICLRRALVTNIVVNSCPFLFLLFG